MSVLKVCLFHKFTLSVAEVEMTGIEGQKLQEVFCYLLIHRNRPQLREILASQMWADYSAARSKKYFRQVLWQLQSSLEQACQGCNPLLLVDGEYIQINPQADYWLDIHAFERACVCLQNFDPKTAGSQEMAALQEAVGLYQGDLLEGWYQDWCLFERERFQNMYLEILDKMIRFCEIKRQYENGLAYGFQSLRYDRANERTHRHLMRLYFLSGNRTQALRQYERCIAALDEELGVKPSKQTRDFYEQIRADQLDSPNSPPPEPDNTLLLDTLIRLQSFQTLLNDLQSQVEEDIQKIKSTLGTSRLLK